MVQRRGYGNNSSCGGRFRIGQRGRSIPPGTDRENDGQPRHLTEVNYKVNYIRNSDTHSGWGRKSGGQETKQPGEVFPE